MPHDRVVHHLRTIISLFPRDELGLTVVHYYDSAIQLARFATTDISEDEFRMGMDAADAIVKLYVNKMSVCGLTDLEHKAGRMSAGDVK
jgi:hypothetical protein